MSSRKNGGKITLGMIKGKPINTSVPSIAIRFNANAEEIEELYQSEEESADKSTSIGVGDPESSPLRSYLPRIGKRSTSVDASLTIQDALPPSDRWKFFSEIKGKLTKSVEDTLTEIKQRNQEADITIKKPKVAKDSSSLSDSEDISESSISKTCGIISTTEGVEMSSDDETPSLEKDKKPEESIKAHSSLPSSTKQYKFRMFRKKKPFEENVSVRTLGSLYELQTGMKPRISDGKSSPADNMDEVESGVEALEDPNLQTFSGSLPTNIKAINSDDNFISSLAEQIVNFEIDKDKTINVKQVFGSDIQTTSLPVGQSETYFAPEGFIDLRQTIVEVSWFDIAYSYRYIIVICATILFYLSMSISMYVNGFICGMMCTLAVTVLYNKFFSLNTQTTGLTDAPFPTPAINSQAVFEVPAVKEYQPIVKFEGWLNEYPEAYNPQTYHISQTQPVYIRLQGNLLRVSHTHAKIPKRAMWNEPKHKVTFIKHRIYNLIGAKIALLPVGLNKKRQWSKKYPICLIISKEQMNFDYPIEPEVAEEEKKPKEGDKEKKTFLQRKKVPIQPQIFSKLTEEEEEFELESECSRPSSPSPDMSGESKATNENEEEEDDIDELLKDVFEQEDEEILSLNDWTTFTPEHDSPTETRMYLFGRTDREKEDWFRRFVNATHKRVRSDANNYDELNQDADDGCPNITKNETEYLKYMAKFQKFAKQKQTEEVDLAISVLWVNTLLGRVLFDCTRDTFFTEKVKERIQRKLSSIKLPYFIEQLSISELSLGSSPPIIHRTSKPLLDHRGLWVDLDITYEGVIVLTLQTKLNLMKLKQPPTEKTTEDNLLAKWQNSDIDDTAESSTDDEQCVLPTANKVLDEGGNPVVGSGGTSNTSKKFIKIVDKIAESKFFQAATEYRYIKKAMEGVSNTDLSLKVELKGLVGTLVLNVPPPPSDRVWIGFRPTPKLWLSAQPIVGERNISSIKYLTNWIERKLSQEFQKLLVIPNMEDIVIPVMSQQLPE